MQSQQLFELMYLFGAAFGVCIVLTPIIRGMARRWGLVDKPDGRRKIHKSPIPVAGGVAVYLTACAVLAIAAAIAPSFREALVNRWGMYFSLFLAASVIAFVGVIDDYCGMRGRYKLFGQIAAAIIVVAGGVYVESVTILGVQVNFGVLGWVFTVFWLLGAINSLNLIDGMDGLLGSVGLILCLAIGGMAFLNGSFAAACVAVTLGGALLAFLGFNFPPASIYLGDAGSMLIGLVIGTLAIQASLKGPATVALAAPLALMIIPIFDTSAAILRRKLTGRSIFTTDRGHLHHVLLGGGLSNYKVLLLVGLLCMLVGGGAVVGTYLKSEWYAWASAISVVLILMVWRLFGITEFLLVKTQLSSMFSRMRFGNEHGRVHQIKIHMHGSGNWNDLWRELTISAEELRLKSMTLTVDAPAIQEGYHAKWDRVHSERSEAPGYWRVEIPLTMNRMPAGKFEVVGLRDEESAWQKLATLANIVENIELTIAAMAKSKRPDLEPIPPPLRPAEGLQLERV